jgi:hypothetical protein
MFGTTFLGHQGWLFQGDRGVLLVDPLLREDFGDIHALGYRVYPPRELDLAAMPKPDAIVLTHEHDDHFDLPSLAKLDRATPVYLSARSSSAARTILAELGFTVHPLQPDQSIVVGDLELVPGVGDHVGVNCGDEWDTLPFLVRHTGGAGSFFTMVDITITDAHVAWASKRLARPGLVTWTNNALDWSHMTDYTSERDEGTQQCFMRMGLGHKLIETAWGTPAAMMMCAGGFAFTGEKAWLNQRVFCVDTEAVCAQMQSVYKKEKFYAARPGQTWWLKAGKLDRVDARAPWLGTAPEASWPSRKRVPLAGPAPDFSAATGRAALADGELDALRGLLREFARALVGGTIFRGLHSLLASEHVGREDTFSLVLRDGDARRTFVYAPTICDFEAREAVTIAGMECYATDLLAVLRGELGPIALTYGRARLWNALPKRFRFDLFGELYRMSHPLRRPVETLEVYRRILHSLPG